jgi:AcrR family transcriptional regulator
LGAALRQEHADDDLSPKARQILQAARDVFLEHGYGAASTDMIQRSAAVSKSTLYAYYPTKDALFAAVVEAECRILARTFSEVAFERRDLADSLRRLGQSYLGLLLSPSALGLFRIVVAETPRFPALGLAFFAAGPDLVKRRLAAYLTRAAADGRLALDNPTQAAEHFLALLRGELQLRALFGVGPPPGHAAIAHAVAAVVACFLAAYGHPCAADLPG